MNIVFIFVPHIVAPPCEGTITQPEGGDSIRVSPKSGTNDFVCLITFLINAYIT